eukprot:403333366
MASHYENYGGAGQQSHSQANQQQQQQKPFIDFYRQGNNQSSQGNYQQNANQSQQQQQQQLSQQQIQYQQQLMNNMLQQQQQPIHQGNSQSMIFNANFGSFSQSSSQNQQYPVVGSSSINLNSAGSNNNGGGGINIYQQQTIQGRDRQSYEGAGRSSTGMQLNTKDTNDYQQQLLNMDPSPINNAQGHAQRNRAVVGSVGYVQGSSDNFIDSNFNTNDTKKDFKHQQNVAQKRRSIENKEAIVGNKSQKDLFGSSGDSNSQHSRQLMNGAKSALANYGTLGHSQATNVQQQNVGGAAFIKQINKNAKVERDPVMEMTQQQSYQNKRQLAKSQSQNRLVLLSQDALSKNNPYQDQADEKDPQATDKNSFFKDQVRGGSHHQTQDLLYKQHMQYSGGHQNTQKAGWLLKASSNNLILSRMTTKSECTFCNKTSAGGMISQSQIPHHCSSIYCSKDNQGMMIQNNLSKKYSTNRDYYNLKIVNDLIYNENTHVVSIFKDYLILDDINEFLKRSYTQQETKVRLPKLCSFYEKYSQVFPNYVVLPESKYMFKNIQRKQKLIDEQYQLQEEIAKKQHQTLLDEDRLFNSKFYNSYYSNMGGNPLGITMNNDLSMSRQQYEHQAKTIAEQAGKKPTTTRIDQMRIDELVDRFLLKDSESNIQLMTSVALDFSEFQNSFVNLTQHSNSKIFGQERPSIKSSTQKQPQIQQQQKVQVIAQSTQQKAQPQISMVKNQNPTPQINIGQGKRSLDSQQRKAQPQNQLTSQNSGSSQGLLAAKKQKTPSFNSNQQNNNKASTGNLQVPKIETIGKTGQTGGDSNKTTPRLQKGQAHSNQQVNNDMQKQLIQTSPATKDAIVNYLQDCNIDNTELIQKSSQKMNIQPHYQTQKLGMNQLLSPTSTNLGSNMLESPQLKSPNYIGPKNPLQNTGSQSSLLSSQQQFQNSLNQQNRQNMKSQLVMPTVSQITSMKKSTRLSNGAAGIKQHNQNLQQQQLQRKNASPMPQQQNYATSNASNTLTTSSRNQQIVSNSTQKSIKSTQNIQNMQNAHTKYLSGGNEQYQKLLENLPPQQQLAMSQQHYETINSHGFNSSNKKSSVHHQLHQQRSKQDLNTDVMTLSQGSHQKLNPSQVLKPPEFNDHIDNDLVTGEDCDDFGIADERFASPDANKIIFQTLDDNIQGLLSQGRKSLESTGGPGGIKNQNAQQIMLTSTEDRLLANTNNYDQIKKHLEQLITVNNTGGQNNNQNMVSLPSQHTFDMNTMQSNNKKYNLHVKSSDKYEDAKQSISSFQPGYNRDGMTQSANNPASQSSQDQINNSRNGTQKKQFESLKQKIRGQFDQTQHSDPHSIQSANKTPNKSSTHSKKSTNHHIMGNSSVNNNAHQQHQQMILNQNRMSLESNQVLMMMPNSNTHQATGGIVNSGIPMSSTSANGRQLSFSQTSFTQNANNYRSITNLQQRKGSNNHHISSNNKELSIESKRLSGQNRQSFKEFSQQSNNNHVQTAINNDQKLIKRSATGKALHLQEANSHSHNFGNSNGSGLHNQLQAQFMNSMGSSQSFQNPNFMSNTSGNHLNGSKKLYATSTNNPSAQSTAQIQNMHHQQQLLQQQQAAGTVRVMTPSYSLASLSKLITPTTTTSPITMTVNMANGTTSNVINRKQVTQKGSIGKSSALGVHSQSSHLHNQQQMSNTLQNSHSQNFLLADKNQKLVTSQLNQNSQKTIISSKATVKNSTGVGRQNNTLQAQSHPIQISTTINQKLGRQQHVPANHHQLNNNHSMGQQQILGSQKFNQITPRNAGLDNHQQQLSSDQLLIQDQSQQHQITIQARRVQPLLNQQNMIDGSSQNLSCTVSTENNNSSKLNCLIIYIAAKAIESNKHPKFMKTIEEYSGNGQQQPTYNTMLSSSIGQNSNTRGGHTLTNSLSQAQLEVKNQKNKIQTVVNSNQASIKRQTLGGNSGTTLSQSGSVSHFKSPSQQITTKKQQQLQGRYLNM